MFKLTPTAKSSVSPLLFANSDTQFSAEASKPASVVGAVGAEGAAGAARAAGVGMGMVPAARRSCAVSADFSPGRSKRSKYGKYGEHGGHSRYGEHGE